MNEDTAFIAALALLIGATFVSRRYLSRKGQFGLAGIALVAHLA